MGEWVRASMKYTTWCVDFSYILIFFIFILFQLIILNAFAYCMCDCDFNSLLLSHSYGVWLSETEELLLINVSVSIYCEYLNGQHNERLFFYMELKGKVK